MSEGLKIVLTASVTLMLFVVSQILQRLFIEPIQEFNKARGRVASAVTRHYSVGGAFTNEDGDVIRDDPDLLRAVRDELRALAAEIRGCETTIPFYPTLAFILRMPSRRELKNATCALQQWSNAIYADYADTHSRMEEVDAGLRLNAIWYHDHTGRADPRGKRVGKKRREAAVK
jgi:hypothetical protein